MKVLITGANGFLGARLAQRLANEGIEVRAMVRRIQNYPELQHPKIELCKGDVSDANSLAEAMRGIQQVYHLAALATDWAADMRDFYRVNVDGTVNVLEAAKAAGVEKIVVTSTAGTIGPPDPSNVYPVDENHIRWVNYLLDYEASKAIADERILQYVLNGLDVVTVSPTRVYGPGPMERKNGYLLLINSYLNKSIAAYPGLGDRLANMVFIDDVVEGHILAMEKGRAGEKYLLGGSNVTFKDLFDTLKKVIGKSTRTLPIPMRLFSMVAGINALTSRMSGKAPMLTRAWISKVKYSWPVSSEKAMRELGYAPVSFEEGIRRTVEWLRMRKER
jgi:nucleoside-diphosphate-sugar epimerase